MNSLLIRAISALILAGLCIAIIFTWKNLGILYLIAGFVALSSFELQKILFPNGGSGLNAIAVLFLVSIWSTFGLIHFGGTDPVTAIQAVASIYIVLTLLIYRKLEDIRRLFSDLNLGLLGLLYLGIFPIAAVRLSQMENGMELFLLFLGIVIAGDIGAYLVGIHWGKLRIAPFISPKKSLEGMLGGLISSFAVGLIYGIVRGNQNQIQFAALALTTGLVAQFGDFFESLLKRVANVKDSGTLLPGHGGVLDRIDGILFACPIFLNGLMLFYK